MNTEEPTTSPSKAAEETSPTKAATTTPDSGEEEVKAVTKPDIDASNEEAITPLAVSEEVNAIVRVSKDSQVRKLISFVMGRLERGGTVTLQALNQCVHKAITVALISRDRLGNIYQVNSLLVVQEGPSAASGEAASGEEQQLQPRVRTTSGIQIILSKSPLDDKEVGYEKPKPKGFV